MPEAARAYFRAMRKLVVALSACFLFLAASCEKENNDQGYRAAGITYRTDSGYTYMDDTVGVGDTLLIGAMVAEGSERLDRLYVEYAINDGAYQRHDSVDFAQNPMALDFQAIMGGTPRTELWGVLAVERNGNTTRHNLRFTVVE